MQVSGARRSRAVRGGAARIVAQPAGRGRSGPSGIAHVGHRHRAEVGAAEVGEHARRGVVGSRSAGPLAFSLTKRRLLRESRRRRRRAAATCMSVSITPGASETILAPLASSGLVERDGARQVVHAGLGGAVGRLPGHRPPAEAGRDVEHAPLAAPARRWRAGRRRSAAAAPRGRRAAPRTAPRRCSPRAGRSASARRRC